MGSRLLRLWVWTVPMEIVNNSAASRQVTNLFVDNHVLIVTSHYHHQCSVHNFAIKSNIDFTKDYCKIGPERLAMVFKAVSTFIL